MTYMENWEDLSEEEKKILEQKTRWRKVLTFFFPIISFFCLKKNDNYTWTCVLLLLLAAIFSAMGQDARNAGLSALAFLFVIFAKFIAISDFTRLVYKSNPFLFKEYLDEYRNYHDVKYDEDGYDEFGFNKSGIHKDTGNEYDKDGFNRDARIALKNAGWKSEK